MAQAGTAGSLLFGLLFAGCGNSERLTPDPSPSVGGTSSVGGTGGDRNTATGPASGLGGSGGGDVGASGGTGSGTGGSAGEAGGSQGGAAGDAGADGACQPSTQVPSDTCEYPESLGGAGDATRCGVTPGAWYPLGESDFTTWPEWAVWRSASGGGLGYTSGSAPPEVAFDPEGRVVVAWYDDYLGGINIQRWNGRDWEAAVSDPVGSWDFDMVLDQAGNPVIVNLNGSNNRMRVRRWRDTAWIVLAESLEQADTVQIAVDAEDRPILAYTHDCDSDYCHISVKRWNGSSFELLPGDGEDGSLSDEAARVEGSPALALRDNGDIVVAWLDDPAPDSEDEPRAVYVQQFDGESWEELGGSATGTGVVPETLEELPTSVTIAVDDADRVLVAWDGSVPESGRPLLHSGYVRVWDGTTWSPAEAGLPAPQLVAGAEGSVYLTGVAHNEANLVSGLKLWRRQAGEWTSLVVPPASPALSDNTPWFTLAVGQDGSLAAGWNEDLVDDDPTYLMVNTDGEWSELGEATARGDGLGSDDGLSSGDRELVALGDSLFLNDYGSCLVARWDGQTWQDLDTSAWTDAEHCAGSTLTESPTGQLVLAAWSSEGPVTYENDEPVAPYYNLHLLGWTGAGWEELTEPFREQFFGAGSVSVAFDSTGTPVVGWTEKYQVEDAGYAVRVIRWDGTAWNFDELRGWTDYDELQLLALPEDRMMLLWDQGRQSAIYNAGQWLALPRLELDDQHYTYRSFGPQVNLVLDTTGTPFLTQSTKAGLALFKLATWRGPRWQSVPADEEHLSTLPERTRWDAYGDRGEIYVRRFENCGWRGLSASDRGGGISNSLAIAYYGSLALHDGAVCVSWSEPGERDSAQLIRCHDWSSR